MYEFALFMRCDCRSDPPKCAPKKLTWVPLDSHAALVEGPSPGVWGGIPALSMVFALTQMTWGLPLLYRLVFGVRRCDEPGDQSQLRIPCPQECDCLLCF